MSSSLSDCKEQLNQQNDLVNPKESLARDLGKSFFEFH